MARLYSEFNGTIGADMDRDLHAAGRGGIQPAQAPALIFFGVSRRDRRPSSTSPEMKVLVTARQLCRIKLLRRQRQDHRLRGGEELAQADDGDMDMKSGSGEDSASAPSRCRNWA